MEVNFALIKEALKVVSVIAVIVIMSASVSYLATRCEDKSYSYCAGKALSSTWFDFKKGLVDGR